MNRDPMHSSGAGVTPISTPAPANPYTCASKPVHLRQQCPVSAPGLPSLPFEALRPQVAGRKVEFFLHFVKDSLGLFLGNGSRSVRAAKLTTTGNPYGPVGLESIRLVEVLPCGMLKNGVSRLENPTGSAIPFSHSFQSGNVELPTLQFSPMFVSLHNLVRYFHLKLCVPK